MPAGSQRHWLHPGSLVSRIQGKARKKATVIQPAMARQLWLHVFSNLGKVWPRVLKPYPVVRSLYSFFLRRPLGYFPGMLLVCR